MCVYVCVVQRCVLRGRPSRGKANNEVGGDKVHPEESAGREGEQHRERNRRSSQVRSFSSNADTHTQTHTLRFIFVFSFILSRTRTQSDMHALSRSHPLSLFAVRFIFQKHSADIQSIYVLHGLRC